MEAKTPAHAPGNTDFIAAQVDQEAPRVLGYTFRVVDGPDRGTSVRAHAQGVVVGSARHADLVLSDAAVSRQHARLVPADGGVEVVDLDSKNGTFVSGHRLERGKVAPGAEILVGRSVIRVVPDDSEDDLEPVGNESFGALEGQSRSMRRLFAQLEIIAARNSHVLIEGEVGVGKLRAARSIHEVSALRDEPFVVHDAESVRTEVLDRDLARSQGTVVIRNFDQLGNGARAVFLACLERQSERPRIIATRRTKLIMPPYHGIQRIFCLTFRAARVYLPPLRERSGDLPILARSMLRELGRPDVELDLGELGRLQAYSWPGNVTELRRVLERRVQDVAPATEKKPISASVAAQLPYKRAREEMLAAFEKEYVRSLLEHHAGNVSRASRAAAIDRVYLHRLIKKHGL